MKKILNYLSKHAECLDTEISVATGISLDNVHQCLNNLTAKREVLTCHATRYVDCIKTEVLICKVLEGGAAGKVKLTARVA
jgi:transcription initiation factor IIE alpha subunit